MVGRHQSGISIISQQYNQGFTQVCLLFYLGGNRGGEEKGGGGVTREREGLFDEFGYLYP